MAKSGPARERSKVLIPAGTRGFGLCGLLGLTAFVSAVVLVHFSNSGIDWTGKYIKARR
jgi:hypothetical protein